MAVNVSQIERVMTDTRKMQQDLANKYKTAYANEAELIKQTLGRVGGIYAIDQNGNIVYNKTNDNMQFVDVLMPDKGVTQNISVPQDPEGLKKFILDQQAKYGKDTELGQQLQKSYDYIDKTANEEKSVIGQVENSAPDLRFQRERALNVLANPNTRNTLDGTNYKVTELGLPAQLMQSQIRKNVDTINKDTSLIDLYKGTIGSRELRGKAPVNAYYPSGDQTITTDLQTDYVSGYKPVYTPPKIAPLPALELPALEINKKPDITSDSQTEYTSGTPFSLKQKKTKISSGKKPGSWTDLFYGIGGN